MEEAAVPKLKHRTHRQLTGGGFRTSVVVIGAGGTGSHVLYGLATLHNALIQLGHPGLVVNIYDNDAVAEHNVGRQRFGWSDIGRNKALSLIARINRMHQLDWRASTKCFTAKHAGRMGNIVITCVDNGKTRNEVNKLFKDGLAYNNMRQIQEEHQEVISTHYWLDLGNDKDYGQAVLAAEGLPTCVDLFGQYNEEPAEDSCSAEQSLRSQDLFVNQAVATAGLSMLWDLFRRGGINKNVVYVNLKDHTTRSAFKPLAS